MFPRGYIRRIAEFVAWLLMAACAILAALAAMGKLFHAEVRVDGDEQDGTPPYAVAEAKLFMCSCQDCSGHVSPEYHVKNCRYRQWYERYMEIEKSSRKGV